MNFEDFTKEQQQAIIQKGSNIIVSAGAGSGKTAVLTQRVLHFIENDSIHIIGVKPYLLVMEMRRSINSLKISMKSFHILCNNLLRIY